MLEWRRIRERVACAASAGLRAARAADKHQEMECLLMNIVKSENGTELTLALEGRLDTTTSPRLEAELKRSISGVTRLVIDMKGLEYISSSGL
ncbi:MAG: STAS domain-containing protein, partial [Candidatus Ventricola sp.]